MLPYFGTTTYFLGPIPIQVWGTFVALGMIIGLVVASRRAQKLGLDKKLVLDAATWILVSAIVGSRIVHVLFYDLQTYLDNPWEVFAIWNGGLASVGGFIAAVLVGVWYFRKHNVDVWKYADATIFGLPIGLGIGRIGCFLIHDHPGTMSDMALAVRYPDGEGRLDHGLFLAINGFMLAIIFAVMSKYKQPVGMYLVVFALWYGVVRFILDFWRTADATYLGLTPAQYVMIGLVTVGVWIGVLMRNGKLQS